jgi:hypothetical protein
MRLIPPPTPGGLGLHGSFHAERWTPPKRIGGGKRPQRIRPYLSSLREALFSIFEAGFRGMGFVFRVENIKPQSLSHRI